CRYGAAGPACPTPPYTDLEPWAAPPHLSLSARCEANLSPRRPSNARGQDGGSLHAVQDIQHLTGSPGDACDRVVHQIAGDARLPGDQLGEAFQQGAAAGEHEAVIVNVAAQLRRSEEHTSELQSREN